MERNKSAVGKVAVTCELIVVVHFYMKLNEMKNEIDSLL